jgi:uncharacterized damage-inducible protein DinB
MIETVAGFADWFEGVRRRSVGFFRTLPPDAMDWAPRRGEYTCGDIIRHVAASERMFVGAAVDGRWRYGGHDRPLGAGLDAALEHLAACHREATDRLRALPDAALAEPRPTLEEGARPVRAWRLLLAMAEHEVHHRSQFASYLTLMGVEPPDVFGLGVEDVVRLTAAAAGRNA